MRLEFAFLADAADIRDDGLFAVVSGGFDLIKAQSLPAVKSAMVLVGRIVFEPSEIGRSFQLHGEIVGPNGIRVPPEMWLPVKAFPHPNEQDPNHPTRANWMTVCLNYQGVSFPLPGEYSLHLSIGEKLLGQVQIEVALLGSQS